MEPAETRPLLEMEEDGTEHQQYTSQKIFGGAPGTTESDDLDVSCFTRVHLFRVVQTMKKLATAPSTTHCFRMTEIPFMLKSQTSQENTIHACTVPILCSWWRGLLPSSLCSSWPATMVCFEAPRYLIVLSQKLSANLICSAVRL